MSTVKNGRLGICSILLTFATAVFSGLLIQRNGISTISAHCTNGANMHVSFHRNFNQTYSLSAEQTVTAFLRTGQNVSKLDIHAVQYCLAINMHNNPETFCDAVDRVIGKSPKMLCSRLKGTLNNYFFRPVDRISNIDSKRGTALACTGLRNKHTLAGLVPNKKYFIDVFGVHKKVPGLIFKLASTSLVFNQSNPIELREDQPEIGRLSEFDKRSTFVFKITNANTQKLMILIIPCGHPVRVKVSFLKKLRKVVDVTSAMSLKFNNFKVNDRFMLKFLPTDFDDGLQKRNFKVVVSTKSRFMSFPMLPADMRIQEVTSLSTCTTSTITWHSSPDSRPVTYCISAIKIRAKNFNDFISSVEMCDVGKYQKKVIPNQKFDCVMGARNESPAENQLVVKIPSKIKSTRLYVQNSSAKTMERFKLKNLETNHGYLVQVTMKVNKEVISYQPLKLFKGHHCFKQILNNYSQLPSAKPSIFKHQYIEDNNILVP